MKRYLYKSIIGMFLGRKGNYACMALTVFCAVYKKCVRLDHLFMFGSTLRISSYNSSMELNVVYKQ